MSLKALIFAFCASFAFAGLSAVNNALAGNVAAESQPQAQSSESNVKLSHYVHRDCQVGPNGAWHRHRRNGKWRDCNRPGAGVGVGIGVGIGLGVLVGQGSPPGPGPGPGPAISDARLKKDVKKLATLDQGIGLYEYSLLGENQQRVGVMAQEVVKSAPHAVLRDGRGILLVDYHLLFSDPAMRVALARSGYQLSP